MTYIAGVELTNWYRFRRVRVDLAARAYAVEAELDGDERASNWVGKSAFVGAVPFALHGWHEFQEGDPAAGYENRWIHHGEIEGGVALTLSNGVRVERTRRHGASTQLLVRTGEGTFAGDAAQAHLDALLGYGLGDYFSTAFVRQAQCSQLVTARPGARMELIAAWLAFEKLDEAARLTGQRVAARAAERDRLVGRVGELRVRARDLGAEVFLPGEVRLDAQPPEWFEARFAALIESRAAAVAQAEEGLAKRVAWDAQTQQRGRRERALGELWVQLIAGALLALARSRLTAPAVPVADAVAAERLARSRVGDAERLVRGEFDGACPVRAGFVCPARAELNAGREASVAALARVRVEHGQAQAQSAEVQRLARARGEVDDGLRRVRERVELLAGEIENLDTPNNVVRLVQVEPPPVTRASLDEARRSLQSAHTDLALYRAAAANAARTAQDLAKAEADLADVEARLVAGRAARLVLGRGGAQRRIAERAVEVIACGANRRLARAGVDLRVGLSWRREGAEPAAACEGCGAAFPRSARVKACERCGAARGRAAQDRLDVELSDRSGAAKDLAGLALQLSACAFLRARRGAQWGVLHLDEPFGALDERHREAASRLVAAVAHEGGVEQLFVVAHQPGILEALPGRVLVRGQGREATVEVSA